MLDIPLTQKIFDKYGLGQVESVVKQAKGITGGVFEINGKFIVKIQNDEADVFRSERNAAVLEILKGSGIKVPELLALDVSEEIIPDKYIVMTRLAGENLKDNWLDFSEDQKKQIFFEYGSLMADFAQIVVPKFGELADPSQQFDNWHDCFIFRYKKYYDYLKRNHLVKEDILKEVNDFFVKNDHLLDIKVPSVLVHNDFQTKNLKYFNGKISGIFDFDECLGGHNEFEFIKTCLPFKKEKVWLDQIIKGYQTKVNLTQDFPQRIRLYTLKFCLKVLTFDHTSNLHSAFLHDKFHWAIDKILHEDWKFFDYPEHLWRQEGIYT